MHRNIGTCLAAAACLWIVGAQAQVEHPPEEEALLGFDPIVLIEGRETLGREDLTAVHEGLRYFFVSDENRRLFLSAPDRYGVQLGRVCARMGGTTGGDADNYLVHDGRIYIFGTATCRERFAADPAEYLERPEAPLPASAAARENGRRLIDQAVKAAGGPVLVDGIRTWREHRSAAQPQRDGSTLERRQIVTIQFPGHLRLDRVLAQGTASDVLRDNDAFIVYRDQFGDAKPGVSDALRRTLAQHWLSLLKARARNGFVAAVIDSAAVGGDQITRVGVDTPEGVRAVLGVDASGRIRTEEFQGRGPDFHVGQVLLTFSEYRSVSGLVVPRRIEAAVAGNSDWSKSARITDVEVNAPLLESTFRRPAP